MSVWKSQMSSQINYKQINSVFTGNGEILVMNIPKVFFGNFFRSS